LNQLLERENDGTLRADELGVPQSPCPFALLASFADPKRLLLSPPTPMAMVAQAELAIAAR